MATDITDKSPPDAETLAICNCFGNDHHRMLDILLAVQEKRRCIMTLPRTFIQF